MEKSSIGGRLWAVTQETKESSPALNGVEEACKGNFMEVDFASSGI
jgi:hypothetical protein